MKTIYFTLLLLLGTCYGINQDCTLIVPENPLSATGLATPYQLVATNPRDGPCRQNNTDQAAFVQGTIFDLDTGNLMVYNPLVITQGTSPAADPVVPTLPTRSVVALWFGFNGNTLTLRGARNGTLVAGLCVNGVRGSPFGQFAYCNAQVFFAVAYNLFVNNKLRIPPLGTTRDGKPCPTVRDFSVVDMDQSDNVITSYLITGSGKIAQKTTSNTQRFPNAKTLSNGSDNGLLSKFILPALGCPVWTVPDLADPGKNATSLPLNEMMAFLRQAAPQALIPAGDPMVQVDGTPNLNKLNLYRTGVAQPPVSRTRDASTIQYCRNMLLATSRLASDRPYTFVAPSPDPAKGNNLFTFLAARYQGAFGPEGLDCAAKLGVDNPVVLKLNNNGVATNATYVVTSLGTRQEEPEMMISSSSVIGVAATLLLAVTLM